MTRARSRLGTETAHAGNRTALVAIIGCCVFGLAACTGGANDDATETSSPPATKLSEPVKSNSVSPSADPGAPIETVYRKYWAEKIAAYAKASIEGTDLKKYAVAEAYSEAETEVNGLKAKGLIATGKPLLAPKVTSVDTERQVPRGSLVDCTDVSKWKLVKRASGEEVSLPKGRLTKYVTRVVAEKWYGHWVIVNVTPEAKTC